MSTFDVVIPLALQACPILTLQDMYVISDIIKLSDKYMTLGGCNLTMERIAKLYRMSERSVRETLSKAKKLGLQTSVVQETKTTKYIANGEEKTAHENIIRRQMEISTQWDIIGSVYKYATKVPSEFSHQAEVIMQEVDALFENKPYRTTTSYIEDVDAIIQKIDKRLLMNCTKYQESGGGATSVAQGGTTSVAPLKDTIKITEQHTDRDASHLCSHVLTDECATGRTSEVQEDTNPAKPRLGRVPVPTKDLKRKEPRRIPAPEVPAQAPQNMKTLSTRAKMSSAPSNLARPYTKKSLPDVEATPEIKQMIEYWNSTPFPRLTLPKDGMQTEVYKKTVKALRLMASGKLFDGSQKCVVRPSDVVFNTKVDLSLFKKHVDRFVFQVFDVDSAMSPKYRQPLEGRTLIKFLLGDEYTRVCSAFLKYTMEEPRKREHVKSTNPKITDQMVGAYEWITGKEANTQDVVTLTYAANRFIEFVKKNDWLFGYKGFNLSPDKVMSNYMLNAVTESWNPVKRKMLSPGYFKSDKMYEDIRNLMIKRNTIQDPEDLEY